METCVFCDVVAGRADCSLAYEDEATVVFMDIGEVNPGHALVVPKTHYANLDELSEHTGMHLFKIARRTALAVRESGVRCEGVNLFLADGKAAFQTVFHLHIHVLPRYKGDAFKISADWEAKPRRAQLDRTASLIREAYQRLWG